MRPGCSESDPRGGEKTERGRTRTRSQRVCGDKGYSSRKIRASLRRRGIRYVIPRRSNERHNNLFDRVRYRARNLGERSVNRLKQFRRIAARR